MVTPRTSWLLLLGALGGASPASADEGRSGFFDPPAMAQRRRIAAVRAEAPPTVDGRLDDAVWQRAPQAGFVQVEPRQGEPSTHRSEVWVAFDDEALYVAARLEQPGGWTAFNQRDLRRDFGETDSDAFSVALDTFGDGRNALVFALNPWGAQRDLQVVDDELRELNWDAVWRSAVSRDDAGWTLELAIPWKSIRHGGREASWGIQFSRRERGRNEDTAWSPYPRTVSAFRMPYAGLLEGIAPPPPRLLSLQLRPYAIARAQRLGDGPLELAPSAGGEVTWSPQASTVVDLTANTDFAETDVDRRVVNLSRFSVFFPERRQFFLESSGVFSAGVEGSLQPFFSRRVGLSARGAPVPISAGARAVYRTPERSAGALLVHTLETPTAQASVVGAGRYTHHLGEQSRAGGMVVMRHDLERLDAEGVTNVVPVADGLFRVGPLSVSAAVMGSSTTRSRSPARFGGAAYLGATLQGNWGWLDAYVHGLTPDFDARAGFVARANVFGAGVSGGLDSRPAWLPSWLRSIGPQVDAYALWATDTQRFQELNVNVRPLWLLFRGGDEAWCFVEQSTQELSDPFAPVPRVSFQPGRYDYSRFGVSGFTQASRKVSVGASVAGGTYYEAETLAASVRGSLQPLPHVQLAGSYGYNRFWGRGVQGDFADTHLLLLETRLALNPRLQLIGSYQRDTAGNAQVVNARLAWEFLPLSFVYVVFTDTRGAFFAPDAPPAEQRVTAKVTYTWRP
jgi:hypothetical protein